MASVRRKIVSRISTKIHTADSPEDLYKKLAGEAETMVREFSGNVPLDFVDHPDSRAFSIFFGESGRGPIIHVTVLSDGTVDVYANAGLYYVVRPTLPAGTRELERYIHSIETGSSILSAMGEILSKLLDKINTLL